MRLDRNRRGAAKKLAPVDIKRVLGKKKLHFGFRPSRRCLKQRSGTNQGCLKQKSTVGQCLISGPRAWSRAAVEAEGTRGSFRASVHEAARPFGVT